jgi:uncharacterized protein (TIGR03032 family)
MHQQFARSRRLQQLGIGPAFLGEAFAPITFHVLIQSRTQMGDSHSATPPAEAALAPSPSREKPIFELFTSRGFESWLAARKISVAFTTYQVGKIFFLGLRPDGKLWVFNRDIGRCLGLAISGPELWVTGESQIYRFHDAMREEKSAPASGPDALYVPQVSYFTGDLDAHDLAIGVDGQPVFVNTRFNCLATVSETHSFRPLWKPPFISRFAAEDRCHLNGVALVEGRPKYATCVSKSDVFDGWRDHRESGGIVVDIETGDIVCSGLSMPHSPRWHDGALWVLNSGRGELGRVNLATGSFDPVCFCPGYLRGLAFIDRFALVGLSKPRENRTFAGLPLDAALHERNIAARCSLYVVDTRTGDIAHSVGIEGVVTELYDVTVIPDAKQPSMIGLNSEEQKRTISIA